MAFCPRLWDTGWHLLSLSRRETDNLRASQKGMLGTRRGKQPLTPPFSAVSLSLLIQRPIPNPWKAQEIMVQTAEPPPPNPRTEKMNLLIQPWLLTP